jgi:hypothetical protein
MKKDYLKEFRNNFKIAKTADLQHVAVAVHSIYEAQSIGMEYLENFDSQDGHAGLRIHTFINLASRIFEHAQAMLVAITTGSPASSEALGRIVVEGSINLMYLTVLGDASTVIGFFQAWVDSHEKKLKDWKAEVPPSDSSKRICALIEARQEAVDIYKGFIESLKRDSGISASDKPYIWPTKLFDRFNRLGRRTDYYESYHRLSGSSHISGEDTMNWLMSIKVDVKLQQKMGAEAWAYSIMMSRFAAMFFVDSIAACLITHGRSENDDLTKLRHNLADAIEKISRAAGVPHIDG